MTRGVDPTPGWTAPGTGGVEAGPWPTPAQAPPVEAVPTDAPLRSVPTIPPTIQAVETVLLPRFLEAPEEPPSLKELADRHGLRPASARPRLGAYIGQLWRFRQFITTYANGRSVASFGTARLGRFWQILSPVANAGIYFVIFGLILGTDRGIENFFAYLSIGVFLFTFTQGVVNAGVKSISGNLGLVRALNFPRASLPLANTLTQVESLVGSMVVLVGIVVFTREPVTIEWAYLLPVLAMQFVFNLGLSLFVARLGAKVPDLRQLLPYVLRIWMYASGVLYSSAIFATNLPEWVLPVIHANPLLVYIELARYSLMEGVPLVSSTTQLWITGGAWALVVFAVGFIYFWRGEAEYGRG